MRLPKAGGGGGEPLVEVTPELRVLLSGQVHGVRTFAERWFRQHPDVPAVAKVLLREKALAKSHRPNSVFTARSCPIIGVRDLGELLVEVTPDGLSELEKTVARGRSKTQLHHLSTIESILPYTEEDVVSTRVADRIKETIDLKRPIKVELFTFKDAETNATAKQVFEGFLGLIGCDLLGELYYAPHLTLYRVSCPDWQAFQRLRAFPPVRRLSYFPLYHALAAGAVEHLFPANPGPSAELQPNAEHPVVAVVDSGIPVGHDRLEPWVVHHEWYVGEQFRSYTHGTMVAGVIAHSHLFDSSLPDGLDGCRVMDICVLPNADDDMGPSEDLEEWELLLRLEDALAKYSQEVKVWNLSLGTEQVCDEFCISDVGARLDALADEYQVCFVVASGNYMTPPLRSWPPQPGLNDRITTPADSVRAITVGAIAGSSGDTCVVSRGKPSPFSRRGPGPSFIIKPDLVHVGGNCSAQGDWTNHGVRSWGPDGQVVETAGTSFSAPRVSRLAAGVYGSLVTPPSLNLLKALVVHSASMPGEARRPKADELNYYGFGLPGNLQSCVTCSETAATLIWEADVTPGTEFSIDDFPYPRCLYSNGLWHGEVWMTLAYNPPLNRQAGFEYCRLNLDVSLDSITAASSLGGYLLKRNGKTDMRRA